MEYFDEKKQNSAGTKKEGIKGEGDRLRKGVGAGKRGNEGGVERERRGGGKGI